MDARRDNDKFLFLRLKADWQLEKSASHTRWCQGFDHMLADRCFLQYVEE